MSSATICKTIFLSVSEVINENVFTMYSPRGRGGESRKSGTSQLALRRLRDLAPQTGRSPFLLSNLPTTAPPRGAIPNSYVCQGTYQRIKGQRLRRRKGGGSVVGESTSHCMEPAGSHDKERRAAMPTCPMAYEKYRVTPISSISHRNPSLFCLLQWQKPLRLVAKTCYILLFPGGSPLPRLLV